MWQFYTVHQPENISPQLLDTRSMQTFVSFDGTISISCVMWYKYPETLSSGMMYFSCIGLKRTLTSAAIPKSQNSLAQKLTNKNTSKFLTLECPTHYHTGTYIKTHIFRPASCWPWRPRPTVTAAIKNLLCFKCRFNSTLKQSVRRSCHDRNVTLDNSFLDPVTENLVHYHSVHYLM